MTPLGVLVAGGAALAVFGLGIPRTDLIVLVLGGAVLGVSALALFLTVITAFGLWLRLRGRATADDLGPLHIECGVPARTGFSLPGLGAVPLIQIAWSWISPRASVEIERRGGRLFEIVRASERRRDASLERRIEIRDALRLTKIAFSSREARPIRALPSPGALATLRVAKSASTGSDLPSPFERPEGERVDMRRYTPGDPMRLILWKTFARTRQVVVRTPEQAISPARKTAAYMIVGEGDEAAAGAARAAVESGALGESWVLGADGAPEIAKSSDEALDVLALSGRAPPDEGGRGLDAFLKRHAADASTRVVVFAPPSPGPWLDRALAAAKTRASRRASQSEKNIEIFVCIDGLARKPPVRALSRILFKSDEPDVRTAGRAATSPPPPVAAKVLRALAASGAAVTIADRRAGRTYSGTAQRALLASSPAEAAP